MKIVENVLSPEQADWLENMCLTQGKWLFLPDSSHKEVEHRKLWPSMSLPVFCIDNDRPVQNKQWLDHLDVLIHTFASAAESDPLRLCRLRFGMYFPIDPGVSHEPHIDSHHPHTVMLYYVNDSDGDTHFYEKGDYSVQNYFNKKDFGPVLHKVSPKKNTAVVFDGNTYHASSNPSENVRITLNLNFGT
tara:strand:- start:119 stop:685 length:567 start_codon:yes stop_codon:yes gene_type:complete